MTRPHSGLRDVALDKPTMGSRIGDGSVTEVRVTPSRERRCSNQVVAFDIESIRCSCDRNEMTNGFRSGSGLMQGRSDRRGCVREDATIEPPMVWLTIQMASTCIYNPLANPVHVRPGRLSCRRNGSCTHRAIRRLQLCQ
jgi:hypothetical protein